MQIFLQLFLKYLLLFLNIAVLRLVEGVVYKLFLMLKYFICLFYKKLSVRRVASASLLLKLCDCRGCECIAFVKVGRF